jgi:hypothetical protein
VLPTTVQLGFGLNPFASGSLVLPLFADGLGMKIVTTRLLRPVASVRRRRSNGMPTTLAIVDCAALTPSTRYTMATIMLFASGLTRSLQFSALNSLAFADIQAARPCERAGNSQPISLRHVIQYKVIGMSEIAALPGHSR